MDGRLVSPHHTHTQTLKGDRTWGKITRSWREALLYGLVALKEKNLSTNWHPRCSLTFKSIRFCHWLRKQRKAGSLWHRGTSRPHLKNYVTSTDKLPTLCALLFYNSLSRGRQSARLQFQDNFSGFDNEKFKMILSFQVPCLHSFSHTSDWLPSHRCVRMP